jgi:hypothetical protein
VVFSQAHELSIPAISALAIHTRTAQLQDKAEHEELKRLVLNYEQREEEGEFTHLADYFSKICVSSPQFCSPGQERTWLIEAFFLCDNQQPKG